MTRPVALCVLLAVGCLPVCGQETPGKDRGGTRPGSGKPSSIDDLIRKIGDEDYNERAAAAEALTKRWQESWGRLVSLETSDDIEVRNQARRILGRLRFEHWDFCAKDAASRGRHKLEKIALLRALRRADPALASSLIHRLAFCHRGLRELKKAVVYMELAVAMQGENAENLYSLAMLQKESGDTATALATVNRGLALDRSSWNLKMLKAAYIYQSGKKKEGLALFAEIKPSAAEQTTEFYQEMLAWSFAVTGQKEKFYAQFERVLSKANSFETFSWISQDPDLDAYRKEPKFQQLVKTHRARLDREIQSRLMERGHGE